MPDAILFIDEARQEVTLVHVMAQRLLEPQQAESLTRHLVDLYDAGAQSVLVDLSSVERLSSIFFRTFIVAGKKARESRAKLAFCALTPMIQEGFAIAGLTEVFQIYKTESDALSDLTRK